MSAHLPGGADMPPVCDVCIEAKTMRLTVVRRSEQATGKSNGHVTDDVT